MGLFLSTARERNLELPPPVQTRGIISSCIAPLTTSLTWTLDELLQTYSHRLAVGPKGISHRQRRWFEAVFNTFCSQLESTKC